MNNESISARNADVLKKCGRATIMQAAWRKYKTGIVFLQPITFAEALREAWANFRNAIDRIAADNAQRAARVNILRSKVGLLGRIANNPTATKNAWGRNSGRYLNTVMGA